MTIKAKLVTHYELMDSFECFFETYPFLYEAKFMIHIFVMELNLFEFSS
jgi:hypothetical protein